VKSLRSAVEKEDHAAIESGTAALEKAMGELAQAAYGAAGAAGGAPSDEAQGGPSGGAERPRGSKKKDNDVIDAEFEETN